MSSGQRYAYKAITSLCVIFSHFAHALLASVVKVSYLQLTWPIWWSARNIAAVLVTVKTQKPDSRVFGMCSPVNE
jgi:hypothetical protein